MRICGRSVVVKDDNLLLMKRFKMGHEYYTLLGGNCNPGEPPAEAAMRETLEESGVRVANPRHIFTDHAGDPYGDQYVFLCEYVDGEPALPKDSEEAFWSTPGKNTYEPLWFPFKDLEKINFVSPMLKEALILARDKGFPSQPYEFTAKHGHRLS